jgi:hypothetical protein
MILNAYAMLDVFVSALRFIVATVVVAQSITAWRLIAASPSPENKAALEDRYYLIALLAFLLLILNVISWPLLYLLLQSYVPRWPQAMCIYGVIQVGSGSHGIAQVLPWLLRALELIKPALVFGSGVWFVLHTINRQTAASSLIGRVLAVSMALGVLAAAESLIELSYLSIPKVEQHPPMGCCLSVLTAGSAALYSPNGLASPNMRRYFWPAFYGVNAAVILALCMIVMRTKHWRLWLGAALFATAVAAPVATVFWIDIVAPALLSKPDHHCLYDLIAEAPASFAAFAIFMASGFAVGWASVAAWCSGGNAMAPITPHVVRRCSFVALAGYLSSIAIVSTNLAITAN